MSDLAYQHGAIQGMAAELKRFVNQIDTDLAQNVEAKFNVLCQADNFDGEAKQAFYDASRQWNQLTLEKNQQLDQIQIAVTAATDDMAALDKSLQGLFV